MSRIPELLSRLRDYLSLKPFSERLIASNDVFYLLVTRVKDRKMAKFLH